MMFREQVEDRRREFRDVDLSEGEGMSDMEDLKIGLRKDMELHIK